ncbi:MAG: hypothetical protein AAF307_01475, partial [Pseudomonadota bacterium]
MSTLVVPVFGGLGNQMFQVAHGVALGQRLGREVAFTDLTAVTGRVTRKWELDCFGIRRLPNTRATALLMRARLQAARRKAPPSLAARTRRGPSARSPQCRDRPPGLCRHARRTADGFRG